MSKQYTSLFIYKLKKEFIIGIAENFPNIRILTDDLLCDATYLFIPEDIDSKTLSKLKGSLGGAYNESFSSLISENEIEKMFNKRTKEKISIKAGDLGFLEGFGSVQMCVIESENDYIVVKPTSVNLFKPIISSLDSFKLCKEETKHSIEYTYNLTVAIDCDIFPNTDKADTNLYYFILKETLARIMYNVYNLVDNINLVLSNPCPLLQMVGASLGIDSVFGDIKSPFLSDVSKAHIRVNPAKWYSVVNVSDLGRGETISSTISVHSLIDFHRSLEVHSNLNSYEIYQLLNRRYFIYHSLLDINLKNSPLGDE